MTLGTGDGAIWILARFEVPGTSWRRIVQELFSTTSALETDQDILERAFLRSKLGRPPGKPQSVGDAVNWECLLKHVPPDQEPCLVSDDDDFTTSLARGELSPYLAAEWKQAKRSAVHFYKRLSAFLKERFSEIDLAGELEKNLLVEDLEAAPNFATARSTLRQLVNVGDFSDEQLRLESRQQVGRRGSTIQGF